MIEDLEFCGIEIFFEALKCIPSNVSLLLVNSVLYSCRSLLMILLKDTRAQMSEIDQSETLPGVPSAFIKLVICNYFYMVLLMYTPEPRGL